MGKELLDLNTLRQLHSGEREPLQSWKWYLAEFPLIGGVRLPTSYCEEVQLPFAQFAQNTKEIASTNITFPGSSSIDGFEMTVYEDQATSSINYFTVWSHLIQNPITGGYRVPAAYWKNLDVVLMDSGNRDIATATINNCWPLGISSLGLDQATNRVKLSIQFVCTSQIFLPKKVLSF